MRECVGLAECASPAGRLAEGSRAASLLPDLGVSGLFPIFLFRINRRLLAVAERGREREGRESVRVCVRGGGGGVLR